MGFYINPRAKTKEDWILEHGELCDADAFCTDLGWQSVIDSGRLPLIHVNNGPFTALALCYNLREARDFSRPDGRAKVWLTVPRAAVADPDSGIGDAVLKGLNL